MAFPHPESRKDHYRNEQIPSKGSVLWNLVERTIDVTNDRNANDQVNAAKNPALDVHDSSIRYF